jgi:hypothetical protein
MVARRYGSARAVMPQEIAMTSFLPCKARWFLPHALLAAITAVLLLGAASPSEAKPPQPISECFQELPKGRYYLTNDLDCSGGEPGNIGVFLTRGGTLDLQGFSIRNADRAVFCGRPCTIMGPGSLADSNTGVESSGKVTLREVTVTNMAEQGVKVLAYLKMYDSRIENSATGARASLKALLVDSEITGNRLDGIRGFGVDFLGEALCAGGKRILLINSSVTGNATGPFDPGDCEDGNATTCADIRTCDRAPRLDPASTCGTSLSVESGTPWGVCTLD